MKQLMAVLLAGGLIGAATCRAEDGSIQNTKEYLPSEKEAVPHHQEVNSTRKSQATRRQHNSRWHIAADWRISYYAHAYARPWYPNAPGD